MLCCEHGFMRVCAFPHFLLIMQAHILVVAVLCCAVPALLVYSSDTASPTPPPPPEGSCGCAHSRTARTAENEDKAADTITAQEPCSDSTLTPPHASAYTSIHSESEQGGVCGGGMVALAGGTFTITRPCSRTARVLHVLSHSTPSVWMCTRSATSSSPSSWRQPDM